MSDKEELRISRGFAQKIISALESKGANLPCPRCGNDNFYLADGFIPHIVQSQTSSLEVFGSGILCVGVICSKCGYFAEHSLSGLGLLEEAKEYGNNDSKK